MTWSAKRKGLSKIWTSPYFPNAIVENFLGFRYKEKWFPTFEEAKRYADIGTVGLDTTIKIGDKNDG
jgi:hypothetical protein